MWLRRTSWLAAAALAAAMGCAGTQTARFFPARAQGQGDGYPAALHQVKIAEQNVASVSVWTAGLYPLAEGQRPIIQVSLLVQNTGSLSAELNAAATQIGIMRSPVIPPALVRPYHVAGNTQIPPGQTGRVDTYYALPDGIRIDDIAGFYTSWELKTPAGASAEYTPFIRYHRPYHAHSQVSLGFWYAPYRYYWPYYYHHRHSRYRR